MDIRDFFNQYFQVPDLKDFIEEKLGKPIPRRKKGLIRRIVEDERFKLKLLYNWLRVERDDEILDMKSLCELMTLNVTGTKEQLWENILQATKYFNLNWGAFLEQGLISEDQSAQEGISTLQPILNTIPDLQQFQVPIAFQETVLMPDDYPTEEAKPKKTELIKN